MKEEEVRDHYWARSRALLTQIYRAAEEFAKSRPDLGLDVWVNGLGTDGLAIADGYVVVSRDPPTGERWTLTIGFRVGGANAWDEAIDYDVPTGFPPFRLPIIGHWRGQDRFGRERNRDLHFEPVTISRSEVSWGGQHWSAVESADASWIVRRLFEKSVLHESPDAAAAAARDGRWIRVGDAPRPLRGGQGAVWKVRDRNDPEGPLYALKEMRWEKSRTSTAYRRFVQEIEATRRLSHPGIVPVLDAFVPGPSEEGDPFYVMPWMPGTLRQAKYLKGNVEGVLRVGEAVAEGLATAHDAGVIHRDVKPENVLVSDDGCVALADFGICFLHSDDGGRLTRTEAATVGSDDFVAPELRGGRLDEVDGRVDVYSLGKTLYAVLAGGPVFPLEHLEDPRYDLRRSGRTPALDHFYGLLARMVATDRADRFESMAACRDALRRARENVQDFRPFEEGMYGGTWTPFERAKQVSQLLREEGNAQRWDRLRDTIDEVLERTARSAHSTATTLESEAAGPPRLLAQQEAARHAVDHVLAVALPLVEAGELRGLERMMGPLWAHFGTENRSRATDPEEAILRAVAAAAGYAVVAISWYRERWSLLSAVLAKFGSTQVGPVYLDIADGHSVKSWRWIVEALSESSALKVVDVRARQRFGALLEDAAGLTAVAFAMALPESAREKAFQLIGADDFPALYSGDWVERLATALRDDSALESGLAAQTFGLTPAEFRAVCRTFASSLAEAMGAHKRPGFNSGGDWLFAEDSAWTRWLSGALPGLR